MKIDIIIVYVPRYEQGHEKNFVPPITGIHLAALTPDAHTVRVIHQQVEPVDLDSAADVIMLSFFSGFAQEAYRLAMQFRGRGKTVVGGGPHVTFHPAEALHFFHAIVTGEAESVWGELLSDIAGGDLRPRYAGKPTPLRDLPTPRYDLLPRSFEAENEYQGFSLRLLAGMHTPPESRKSDARAVVTPRPVRDEPRAGHERWLQPAVAA